MTDGIVAGVGGGENLDQSFAGAGIADSAAQIANSLDEQDPIAVLGGGVAASLNLLGLITNPVDAIGTSAMGWLIEHLWFLDGFLDNTVGDPNAIDNATTALGEAATELDRIAADQVRAYEKVEVYRAGISQSKLPFEQRVEPRAEEIKLQSIECSGLGRAVNFAGMWVAVLRGIIRDLLAEFAWWVLQEVAIAMSAAPFTGGGSIATGAARVILRGVDLSRKLATKMTEIAGKLQEISATLKRLAEFLGRRKGQAVAEVLTNALPAFGKGVDDSADLFAPTAYERAKAEVQPPPPPPPPQRPWSTSGNLDGS